MPSAAVPSPDLPAPTAAASASAASAPAPAPTPPPAAAPAGWLRRRLVQPLLDLLKSGLSPAQLALTVGLGVAFGVAPTVGLTTLISSAVALRLRLNVAAMQFVVHVLSPLQLLLLVPLLRAGATVLGHGEEVRSLRLPALKKLLADDGWAVLRLLWRAELGAVLVWALASVPVVALLYVALKPVFAKVLVRQRAAGGEMRSE